MADYIPSAGCGDSEDVAGLDDAPGRGPCGDTLILRKFHRHQRLRAVAKSDVALDWVFQLEHEIMALPTTCAADLAAKAIIATENGDAILDFDTAPFWVEARALVEGRA